MVTKVTEILADANKFLIEKKAEGNLYKEERRAAGELQWDLLNFQNIPVASGMYLAHIEMVMPSGGEFTKTLKLAIIQEKEMLDIY